MQWFDPTDEVAISPSGERSYWWRRKFGRDDIEIAEQVLFANNGHGALFDAVCAELDRHALVLEDLRSRGYFHVRMPSGTPLTVYRAPEPAPYAAADLDLLVSAGARQVVFLNGAGSLCEDVGVGSVILPGDLVREEGTSFHYAPPEVTLRLSDGLNRRIRQVAAACGVVLVAGKHWTTDALYRETLAKIRRFREEGVVSVEMELSALAGVAHFRRCEFSALLVVTDLVTGPHTWDGTVSAPFRRGVTQAVQVVARVFGQGEVDWD